MSDSSTKYGTGTLNTNSGANNSAFGFYAGYSNADASCNTAVGSDALVYTTHGPHNTAIGAGSMCSNILGQSNTAVGSGSLAGNPTLGSGEENVAVGAKALYNNYGNYNVGVGCYTLQSNTDGSFNTAVGYSALQANTTGPNNTAIGYLALLLNDASNNTAVGSGALASNTSGFKNTAVGSGALGSNVSGPYNTALGYDALSKNNNGSRNTAIGYGALAVNIDGSNNTAIGFEAGSSDISGNFNTFIGYQADVSNNPVGHIPYGIYKNSTALGYKATIDASNQIIIGGLPPGGSYPSVKIPGSYVGINGVYNPLSGFNLDVSGVLQVQDGTVDSFASLHGLKVSPSEFFYNSKNPTSSDSFKIELAGANCKIYKGVGTLVGSATVIQNNGTAGGIALATTTTAIYVNESGSVPGVGIMTASPNYTLDVSGNVNFKGLGTNATPAILNAIYPVGSVYTTTNNYSPNGPTALFLPFTSTWNLLVTGLPSPIFWQRNS